MSRETKKLILIGLYIALMIIVNTIGVKIMLVWRIRVSAGIICMPFLFVISDAINEVFGRQEAERMTFVATGLLVLLIVLYWTAIILPPHPQWTHQAEFEAIFSQSLRMAFASAASFLASQWLDVIAFSRMREAMAGKWLYFRSVASTAISQAADTLIFMFLAFYMADEGYGVAFVMSLAWPYFLAKLATGVIFTPLCHLAVWWCHRGRCAQDGESLSACLMPLEGWGMRKPFGSDGSTFEKVEDALWAERWKERNGIVSVDVGSEDSDDSIADGKLWSFDAKTEGADAMQSPDRCFLSGDDLQLERTAEDMDFEKYDEKDAAVDDAMSMSDEPDECTNPNIAMTRQMMLDCDAAYLLAEPSHEAVSEDKEENLNTSERTARTAEETIWWEEFHFDPKSLLGFEDVNLSYREWGVDGRFDSAKEDGRAEQDDSHGRKIQESADFSPIPVRSNPNDMAYAGFGLVEQIVDAAYGEAKEVGERSTIRKGGDGLRQWWDAFKYDRTDVLPLSEVNLSYRQHDAFSVKRGSGRAGGSGNGRVEQTAPDWALGEWYVDEGEFGMRRVVTFRRNCYVNQNSEDIGLIEYGVIGINSAVEHQIVKRTDSEFSIELHEGGVDLVVYHLKRDLGGFKMAMSVAGNAAKESDFVPAVRKEEGVKAL